jgi:hypothetical protein
MDLRRDLIHRVARRATRDALSCAELPTDTLFAAALAAATFALCELTEIAEDVLDGGDWDDLVETLRDEVAIREEETS